MNYRFRVSEHQRNSSLPIPTHRRYRLKGKRTVRLSREEAERLRLSLLFEQGELPEGAPKTKKRKIKKVRQPKQKVAKHRIKKGFAALVGLWQRTWSACSARAARAKTATLPIFAGALCAALLVSFVSSGAVLFHLFGGYHASYTSWTVPNFVGKEPQRVLSEESVRIEDELPWNLIIQYVDHAEIPAGQVISQAPAAGVVRRIYQKNGFCNITLTVSRGLPTFALTDLIGKSVRDARLVLQNHGIESTLQEINTPAQSETVLGTIPEEGTLLHEGDKVILQISRKTATPSVSLPSLLGLTEEKAATLLRTKGLAVGKVSYQNSSSPAGTVIAQSPTAGTLLSKGSTISYTVSIGEAVSLRTVPELLGLSYADAIARLREHGLVVGSLTSVHSAAPHGTVIQQSPAAGTPITSSTVSVDLYLSN